MRLATALCVLLLSATATAAETYIVPLWGVMNGGWYPQLTVTNPHQHPVTVRVVRGYPLVTDQCNVFCTAQPVLTIAPRGRVDLRPFWFEGIDYVAAGAFELETSAPVRMDAMFFSYGVTEIRQRLEVARAWLPAGEHLATTQRSREGRMNVVVVNPNPFAIEVSVWSMDRGTDEIRIAVPPHATRMATLPKLLCGDEVCPPYPDIAEPPTIVYFDSPASFLAGVSSIAPSWAMFSLAGVD